MLHRTRNLGVVGTRGGGLLAWTKGAISKLKNAVQRIKILISQDGDILVTEDDITLSPER
jgi:adenine specific DNA methylase Mod